jgi:flagellar motor protein MotB
MVMMMACKSQQQAISTLELRIGQLRSDSTAMERRIRQLSDENSYLSEKCATVEQSLIYRLQEKEDSLRMKEQVLNEREQSLSDMKARKEQEQEAFDKLASAVMNEFSEYAPQLKSTRTTCSQIVVEFSDKVFFQQQSLKADSLRESILVRTARLLKRNDDLRLIISVVSDSLLTAKEKPEDAWMWSAMRANVLLRELIRTHQVNTQYVQASAVYQQADKRNAHLGKNRVMLVFQSALLPCIQR